MTPPLTTLYRLPNIRRAWPGAHHHLTFEQYDDSGRLRAGEIDAEGTVTLAGFAHDPNLPELQPPTTGTLVVHRLHKRAVVLEDDHVRKYLRRNRVAGVVAKTQAMHQLCSRAGLSTAAVHDVTEGSICTEKLPGATLHQLGNNGLEGWEHFSHIWPKVVRQPQQWSQVHTARDECSVVTQWFHHAAAHQALPNLPQFQTLVGRVCGDLLAGESPPAVAHRDLHDKQLLWDGHTLSLLDTDTATLAEPALDLGNLLAHVHLRRTQQVFDDATLARLTGIIESLAATLDVSQKRLHCYTRSATIRLACLYAFRPSSQPWLAAWIAHCLQA